MDTTDFHFQCGQEISHYTSLHQDAILLKGCGDPWLGRVNMHSTRPGASREALGSSDPTDLISLLQRVREGQDISNPFQLTGKSTCRSDRDPLPSSAAAQLKKGGPWCVCVFFIRLNYKKQNHETQKYRWVVCVFAVHSVSNRRGEKKGKAEVRWRSRGATLPEGWRRTHLFDLAGLQLRRHESKLEK